MKFYEYYQNGEDFLFVVLGGKRRENPCSMKTTDGTFGTAKNLPKEIL